MNNFLNLSEYVNADTRTEDSCRVTFLICRNPKSRAIATAKQTAIETFVYAACISRHTYTPRIFAVVKRTKNTIFSVLSLIILINSTRDA